MAVFVVEFTYNVDRAEREKAHRAHADYLAELTGKDILLGAGPLTGVNGGLLIYRVADSDELRRILDNEPYVQAGYVADTRVREWRPGKGAWFATQAQPA
jgi:uncharacterized protein YciI